MWHTIGHEAAIELLENSLKHGRPSHAYIFIGPPQVGKMTLAIDMAKALNCDSDDIPCGTCASCRRIAEMKHADVQVIDLAGRTEISIDQIKELEHCISLKPFEGRARVFIIEDALRLSLEAANCLLKTLEEPPPYATIILLAANPQAVLPTILSRCRRVDLKPVPIHVQEKALIERFDLDSAKALKLARLSSGCPGWAIEASRNEAVIEERKEQLRLIPQISNGNQMERMEYAARLAVIFGKNRTELLRVLSTWISWWRDLLLIKGRCKDIIVNIDHKTSLESEAAGYTMDDIKGFIDSLLRAIAVLKSNANPRLVFDVLMLSIPKKMGR